MTKIIAFAGRKQSGKTSCSQYVSSILNSEYRKKKYAYKIYNFADPLKHDVCMNILGLTYEQCYGTDEQKNELVGCFWDGKQLSAREVMQIVGTDMFRRMKTNVWAAATINKIKKDNLDFALIADCRFPNEVEAVKDVGGLVIKLTRNPFNSDHASEIALDENNYHVSNFDLIIYNHNLTITEQNEIIYNFLKNKKVLS